MRILMLCTKFELGHGNDYLTNELATALRDAGHQVQIVLLEWGGHSNEARIVAWKPGIDVLVVPPIGVRGLGRFVERATKWATSSFYAHREIQKLDDRAFDAMIGFAPGVTFFMPILRATRRLRDKSYLVIWDFFPDHHRSIGMFPNAVVFHVARILETLTIRRFRTIGCMTQRNVTYLKSRFHLRAEQRVEVLPIWGETSAPAVTSRAEMRRAHNLPADGPIIVFGGQLTEGRGVDDVLRMADIAKARDPRLKVLILGEGRLAEQVAAHAARPDSNVIYRPRIPRGDYLQLLCACDVGIVATVRNVEVPTFPSKIIDYLRVGLPVLAAVEASTDFGEFVEANGVGRACLAGDAEAMADLAFALSDPARDHDSQRARARTCLETHFDVRLAAKTVLDTLMCEVGR